MGKLALSMGTGVNQIPNPYWDIIENLGTGEIEYLELFMGHSPPEAVSGSVHMVEAEVDTGSGYGQALTWTATNAPDLNPMIMTPNFSNILSVTDGSYATFAGSSAVEATQTGIRLTPMMPLIVLGVRFVGYFLDSRSYKNCWARAKYSGGDLVTLREPTNMVTTGVIGTSWFECTIPQL